MRLPLISIGLAVLNVVAVLAICSHWVSASKRIPLTPAVDAHAAQEAWRLEVPTPAVDLDTLQTRTMFHKSRSFYVAPPPPSMDLAAPDYRFSGSMSVPNQAPTAILVNNQTNARAKVKVGDVLEQWTVTEIGPRHVILSLGERTAEIGSMSGARGSGLTVVTGSAHQQAQPPPSQQAVRVLSGPSGTRSGLGPAAANASTDEQRMYRPPNR